jgi:succinyl-CoA synthetase beta subunit
MRLYEFEGMELFRREGIPVPEYTVVTSPQEARQRATELGLPVVIKAQVLSGGRGLAGGVRNAESLEQVEEITRHILSSQLKGITVERLIIARKVEIAREIYLGVTVDGYNGVPVIILSLAGGVSIEELARTSPEMVVSRQVTITDGLSKSEALQIVKEAGLTGEESRQIGDIIYNLYIVFRKYDALITEINPLALTPRGACLALDAKVEIDDSSLYRHPEFINSMEERISNPLERKGRQIGVTYVEMDGDIGLISSGAGLGMATIDIIGRRFRAANFLETGGAITAELLYKSMDLVMQKKGLKAVFINLYGGINPIHEGARGIVQYIQEHRLTIPIIAKALGNRQEETWEILKGGGVNVVTDIATEKGIDLLTHLLEESK